MSGPEFEVTDPQGYLIRLDRVAWVHILTGHPEICNLSDSLKATIEEPNIIQALEDHPSRFKYYRLAERDKYLMAVVQRNQSTMDGRVVTAFLVRKIHPQGEIVWAKKNSK